MSLVLTTAELNIIWSTRTAQQGYTYVCEDGFLYVGQVDGTLVRKPNTNQDDWIRQKNLNSQLPIRTKTIVQGTSSTDGDIVDIKVTDDGKLSSNLPDGAATSDNQVTGNTSLVSINTNIGAKDDTSASSDTGTFSLISLFKRALTKLTTINTTQTDGSQKTQIVTSTGANVENKISTLNTTTTLLGANQTYTGTWEDVNQWSSAAVTILGTNATNGVLWIDVRRKGSSIINSVPFTKENITSNPYNLPVIWNIIEDEFRVRYINGSTAQTTEWYLETKFSTVQNDSLIGTATSAIDNYTPMTLHRTILSGQKDNGTFGNVPITPEGHLEVAVHSSLTPFYALHTEKYTPVFQTDGVYSVNSGQILSISSGSGSVTNSDSLLIAATGTTIYSSGILQSRKRLRYRAGQGSIARFTAVYTTPVANSYQLAGIGHAEDGVYLGYGNTSNLSDTSFGILYVNRGVREIKTLTLTTRATSAGNVTITLNGVATTVALTNSTLQQNVWEISQATYVGWEAYPSGATVVFLRSSSGVTAGTQTYGAGTTGSAATIVQTKAGVASTDTFIPQSSWNGDKLDGTGASGVTINPQKLNVFEIALQYLGAGSVVFRAEVAPSDSNNAFFVDIHTIKLPNTLTTSSFGNPSFPFTMAAYSAGSTTNLQVKTASFAGFNEGMKTLQGNRFSYNTQAGVTANTTTLNTEFTIMNPLVYQGRSNQSVINLVSISAAQQHNNVTTIYLIKNGALVGAPNFTSFSTISMSLWDTAATSVTTTDGSQQVWSAQIGAAGNFIFEFADEITLQPGEWITVAARSAGGGPVVYLTLNTREDQ